MTKTVAEAVILAAKDRGDVKGDKQRKAAIASLVQRAQKMSAMLPGNDSYPEVREAIEAVQELSALSEKLSTQSEALLRAPTATVEAEEAQRAIDKSRKNMDALLHPLEATVSTLETLLAETIEMERSFRELALKLKTMKETLEAERTRVGMISKSVINTAKMP